MTWTVQLCIQTWTSFGTFVRLYFSRQIQVNTIRINHHVKTATKSLKMASLKNQVIAFSLNYRSPGNPIFD